MALVWGALGAFGYVAGWQWHARAAGGALVHAASARLAHAAARRAGAPARPCVLSAPRTGQLAGLLEIPALHLVAPVEEGTSDTVLSVAVGHDPRSVWPGAAGTAALLAHDVSYFVHLDRLRAGDSVVYRTACATTRFVVTGSEIVSQGTPLPRRTAPTLVLDTCYPSNALFFTSQRLLVWAVQAGSQGPRTARHAPAGLRAPATTVSYHVAAPASLVAQGLTLQQNEAPMGTMTIVGNPSPGWTQSPGPLALESAALEAYFGGLHAAAQSELGWWRALAVGGVMPPVPILGARITAYDAPLDVTIDVTGATANQVVLHTVVTVAGGAAPGTYAETVTAVVHATAVAIGDWTLRAV